ncbi:MAG TPA: DUF4831 family protein [Bacteroidales bacterium]|nr:DUF4831 family protein [Bacteroidales bacterium]HQH15200.1 DUF4831 family protein [Bacteroidales bacterium]
MKKWMILIILLALFTSLETIGQVSVISVSKPSGKPSGTGMYYTLPRTTLRVDVELKIIGRHRGPLSDYAEKFLGITNAIKFDDTLYELGNISVTPLPEPDPEEIYYIELGLRDQRNPKKAIVEINEEGFLVFVNNLDTEPKTATEEKVVFLVDQAGYSSDLNDNFLLTGRVNLSTDTIIRRVAVDTIMVEQLSFRKLALEKPGQDMAAEVVEKIEELRSARMKLLTGFQEVAYDAEAIKYMDKQIREMEDDYLDFFRGKSLIRTKNYSFYYTPPAKLDKSVIPLFRFSSADGIGALRGGSGDNIDLDFKISGSEVSIKNFSSSTSADPNLNGIAYRIPESVIVSIKLGETELFSRKMLINQLGAVRRLPVQKVKAEFSIKTGGIKSLVIE